MRAFLKSSVFWLAGRFDRTGGGVPVLLYHSLDDGGSALSVPPRQFRAQMEHLARSGWRGVGIGALLDEWDGRGPGPRRTVAITLDDGLVSQRDVAFPILRDLGLGATVFVPTAQLGRSAEWNRVDRFPEFPIMGWKDVETMAAAGIEMEPHGRLHRSLPGLDDAALADEVAGSAGDLCDRLGRAPRVFSYPFGHEDERVRRAVRAAGVPGAVAVADRVHRPGDDRLRVPRLCMDWSSASSDRQSVLLLESALKGGMVDVLRLKRAVLEKLRLAPSTPAH